MAYKSIRDILQEHGVYLSEELPRQTDLKVRLNKILAAFSIEVRDVLNFVARNVYGVLRGGPSMYPKLLLIPTILVHEKWENGKYFKPSEYNTVDWNYGDSAYYDFIHACKFMVAILVMLEQVEALKYLKHHKLIIPAKTLDLISRYEKVSSFKIFDSHIPASPNSVHDIMRKANLIWLHMYQSPMKLSYLVRDSLGIGNLWNDIDLLED